MVHPNKPSNASSSTSAGIKLALLAALALLFLNLSASLWTTRQQPSLRNKRPRTGRQNRRQSKPQQQQWKVVKQYEEYEEYDESTGTTDSSDIDGGEDSYFGAVGGMTEQPLAEDVDKEGGDSTEMKGRDNLLDKKLRRQIDERGKKRGKIAWLMSFPNSGTSFTLLLIRRASNFTVGTNYGMESNLGPDGKSVPVYERSVAGPYWLHPPQMTAEDATSSDETEGGYTSGTKMGKEGTYGIPPATALILTKTHCGSRCAFCPPERYLETSYSFLRDCLSGSRKVTVQSDGKAEKGGEQSPKYEKQYSTYNPALVEKAVHLIRNPFDNLVSRFHHEQKEHKKKGSAKWMKRYSNDVTGFKKWCADEDALYAKAEKNTDWEAYGFPADTTRYFEGVSCHGELLRYVQWHVEALRAVEMLDIPVMYVYYEDYSTDLKGSTDQMLGFLNLDRVGKLPYFNSNKDYSAYFTQEERVIASNYMKKLSSDKGRELLERYWVAELDYEKLRKETKNIK